MFSCGLVVIKRLETTAVPKVAQMLHWATEHWNNAWSIFRGKNVSVKPDSSCCRWTQIIWKTTQLFLTVYFIVLILLLFFHTFLVYVPLFWRWHQTYKQTVTQVIEQSGDRHTVSAAGHCGIISRLPKARFGQQAEALHHLCSLLYPWLWRGSPHGGKR